MAEIREVRLVDDLDGSVAAHTVDFMIDGKGYEIDLSEGNYEKLLTALEGYVSAARSVKPVKASRGGKRDQEAALTRRTYLQSVRAWCKVHNIKVSERGRIPGPILEAYEDNDPARLQPGEASQEEPSAPPVVVPLFDDGGVQRSGSPRTRKKASAN